jgi:hypothetical protein
MKSINTILKVGTEANLSKAVLKGTLLVEGYSEAEANKALKEAGLTRGRSGFRSELYAKLKASDVTASEFAKLLATASDNVKKYESHYEEIRILVNAVRANAKR